MPVPQPYSAELDGPLLEAQAREWWRWHFAGQAAGGLSSIGSAAGDMTYTNEAVAKLSVVIANLLIAELEREK